MPAGTDAPAAPVARNAPAAGILPITGFDIAGMGKTAAGLLLTGSGALVAAGRVGRRRRGRHTSR
jgi:hypothetical protein